MKNIFLNSRQIELIRESIENKKQIDTLPKHILTAIENGDTPLSGCKHSDVFLKELFREAFLDAKDCFNDDIEKYTFDQIVSKLNKLIFICQKKEEKVKEILEKLCSDLVLSAFELNGKDIELECNLLSEISKTKLFHVKSELGDDVKYNSLDDIDIVGVEKQKRQLINTIVVGASMSLTEKLLKESLQEIFEIDEELPHLYNKIIKINNYLMFLNNEEITDKNNMQGAYEDITISKNDNKVKVKSEGIIFPFLLTETIRGFIEILSSETLPEDEINRRLVLDSCDLLKNEPWYMMIGELLWKRITLNSDVEIKEYEHIFMKLFDIESEEFISLISEVLANTILGKDEIEKLFSKIKYDYDYKSFEKDLDKKRKENAVIIDEYINEDELN